MTVYKSIVDSSIVSLVSIALTAIVSLLFRRCPLTIGG